PTVLKWIDLHRKSLMKEYDVSTYRKAKARQTDNKNYDPIDLTAGFDRFKQQFTVPQDMLDILVAKAQEAKIEYTDSAFQATLPMLKLQLKALVARDLWDMSEYFQIINPTNEIYQCGLEAIKDDSLFEKIKSE
ncbi:MAG: hypothetical protein K2H92_06405, partial [Bacteroidaceae bacterium]|nr:hypothetical protein [Bacteroidaceae bacterium]